MEYGFWSIMPPVVAIVLALLYKNVFIALFSGCFLGYLIIDQAHLLRAFDDTLMSFIRVFEDNDNTIVILLVAVLGGLIVLIEEGGGIRGFTEFLTARRSIVKTRRGANLFTWIVGVLVFTSGTLSTLVTGAVARPLNDAMRVSHEKFAYIVHSTSTPVCVLIPLSGWGAFMIGLIHAQGINDGAAILALSIPLNFYCLITVFSVLFFAFTGKDFGPMRRAERRSQETGALDHPRHGQSACQTTDVLTSGRISSSLNLLIPLLIMVIVIIIGLLITGEGNLLAGDGMRSILWGIVLAVLIAAGMLLFQQIFTVKEIITIFFKGAGDMISVAAILILAFSMGSMVKMLGTGLYLGNLFASLLIPGLLPAIIFLLSCLISFSTGTSMGTMAVMMPLAMPMAIEMHFSVALVAAALFGGAIFGDHSSPISDTTVLSCASTGCDIMDHVRTQLPYALVFGGLSFLLYIVAGLLV